MAGCLWVGLLPMWRHVSASASRFAWSMWSALRRSRALCISTLATMPLYPIRLKAVAIVALQCRGPLASHATILLTCTCALLCDSGDIRHRGSIQAARHLAAGVGLVRGCQQAHKPCGRRQDLHVEFSKNPGQTPPLGAPGEPWGGMWRPWGHFNLFV